MDKLEKDFKVIEGILGSNLGKFLIFEENHPGGCNIAIDLVDKLYVGMNDGCFWMGDAYHYSTFKMDLANPGLVSSARAFVNDWMNDD